MASQNVLTEAINKLVQANANLKTKIASTADKKQAKTWLDEMHKNESMILDYKFRLQYENVE